MNMSSVPILKVLGLLVSVFNFCDGQCNGPPVYILPNNSTGNLAFPESNLDPMTGAWSNNQFYPVSASCTWVLKAPPLHVIYLKILFFDSEENFDQLTLYPSEDRKKELFKFSGDLQEVWEVITPDNTLVVDFFSDEFTTYYGFHLAFMYFPQACVAGGAVVNEPQLIALPPWNLKGALPGPKRSGYEPPDDNRGMPLLDDIVQQGSTPRWEQMSSYPQGLNCTWHAEVSTSQLLVIDVLQFQTDADDILQVWKMKGEDMKPFLKFWDNQIPRRQIKSCSPLLLNFISLMQEQGANTGFLLNVSYISRACDSQPEVLTTPRGYIAYPSYNLKGSEWDMTTPIFYGPDSCDWLLNAPEGYAFNITFLQFDTRPEDVLDILDGGVSIFSHGGNFPPSQQLLSEGNQLHVRFAPSAETRKTGFLFHFTWFLKDCRFQLDPAGGDIRSPFYPDVYGTAFQCTWLLTPPKGSIAHILIARLRLDHGDFLQITDGDKNVIFTPSSVHTDLVELAPTSSVTVNFLSDNIHNKGYFLLKYDVFSPGNCNFSLTSCGWSALDEMQVWTFRGKERMMVIEEKTSSGLQLPRGYRSTLASPFIHPSKIGSKMCLQFKYVLTGQDAFLMTVAVNPYAENVTAVEMEEQHPRALTKMRGAQGKFLLNAVVNITESKPFQILITYERGYGPHYRVGVSEITLSETACGAELENMSSFSCKFHSSFCGWRNTHTDHQNWELGNEGVTALVGESLGITWGKRRTKLQDQFADLLSPPILVENFHQKGKNSSSACLSLAFQIYSSMTELKLIISGLEDEEVESVFFGKTNAIEYEIWSQGRVASTKILHASIPLDILSLPSKFRVILRGVFVRAAYPAKPNAGDSPGSGVSVHHIHLKEGSCSNDVFSCDFNDGFCSWRTISTGNSVWHIKDEESESFAAVLSQGSFGESSQMISPPLEANTIKTLSFRYLIQQTNQCIKIGVLSLPTLGGDHQNASIGFRGVWEQCRDKGNHWLNECIQLPISDKKYQIIIASGSAYEHSKIWIDDIHVSSEDCPVSVHTKDVSEGGQDSVSFECRPQESLCGMTQPLPGSWDWAYYHAQPNAARAPAYHLNHESEPGFESPYAHEHGHLPWGYNPHNENKVYTTGLNEQEPSKEGNRGQGVNMRVEEQVDETGTHGLKPRHESGSSNLVTCPDGRAIEPAWLCDGVPDCDDNSDEKYCNCGPNECGHLEEDEWNPAWGGPCGDEGFMCPSGRVCPPEGCPEGGNPCLPRTFLCDGLPHCVGGEDEHACAPPQGDSNNHLSPEYGWMSDSPHIPSGTHAEYGNYGKGSGSSSSTRFECSGGLLLPKSFLCDGRKDCPLDGMDEVGCLHCGPEDFLCPVSGVCLPKSVVCDGDLSIPTCSDELGCMQCLPGHFACDICIPSMKICDGVWDCSEGEDELRCLDLSPPRSEATLGHPSYMGEGSDPSRAPERTQGELPSKCQHYHFTCPDERCIPLTSVCDRQQDCFSGQDEHNCPDDNTEEEYYMGAKMSSSRDVSPWSVFPSYLITPVLTHPKDRVALLSFRYRLDAWLGPSNITLSVELLNENDAGISIVPWSLWRQTGHKGKLWLHADVIIPELPDTNFYRIGFLLSGGEASHGSQQILLSRIQFKTMPKKQIDYLGHAWANCEFGKSWCGWSQAYTEQGYSWVHAMTSPHARRTGPIRGFSDDESSGFIFTDSLLGREGDAADLLSPAIQFEREGQSLCFRFGLFLYGAHVAKLSVHVMQVTSTGHPFTVELFHTSGGRGLSWIPISLTIDDVMLREPTEPFLVVIRATRGNGPEADIALDQMSFTEGSCDSDTFVNPQLLLRPLLSSTVSYIRSLKAGPSLTPYLQRGSDSEEVDSSIGLMEKAGKGGPQNPVESDLVHQAKACSSLDSCSRCVSAMNVDCVWCIATSFCYASLSTDARSCPLLQSVHNNATNEERSGAIWCPRIAPRQATSIYASAEALISLPIAVTNIQVAHTTSDWVCIFTLNDNSGAAETIKEIQAYDHSKMEPIKNENESEIKSTELLAEAEDKELWRRLKSYAVNKNFQNRIKVTGKFQGSVFRSNAEDSSSAGLGVGVIHCGDGDSKISLPDGAKLATAKVEIQTLDGTTLDNPDDLHLVVFECEEMASDCDSCLGLNSSLPCGWCAFKHVCTARPNCPNGLWHSVTTTPNHVCSVQHEIDFIKELLEAEENEEGVVLGTLEEEFFGPEMDYNGRKSRRFGSKRRVRNKMKKSFESNKANRSKEEEDDEEETKEMSKTDKRKEKGNTKRKSRRNRSEGKEKTSSDKNSVKGSVKFNKKGRSRGFLKVPTQNGVFVARDVWRLHTGRQYYVPVTKKTLINLGFVRHVTYGRLTQEKSRTVLMEGSWKKAAGFYIDLYEKAGQDPMTSIITTNKEIFDKMLTQILPD